MAGLTHPLVLQITHAVCKRHEVRHGCPTSFHCSDCPYLEETTAVLTELRTRLEFVPPPDEWRDVIDEALGAK